MSEPKITMLYPSGLTAVEITHGLRVAFKKEYFIENFIKYGGTIYNDYNIVVESVDDYEVYVRFEEISKYCQ